MKSRAAVPGAAVAADELLPPPRRRQRASEIAPDHRRAQMLELPLDFQTINPNNKDQ